MIHLNPELQKDIGSKVDAIVNHPNDDFAELLQVANLDPSKDLRYADWSEVDFGENDISGWDFTGARLNRANLSKVKNADKAFFNRDCNEDTTTEFEGTILPEGFTVEMLLKLGL